jgi:hypothetical protein
MFLAHYNWVVKNQEYVSEQFDLDEGNMVRSARHLIKQYRTLLPGNPSGAIFGLLYEEPSPEEKDLKGGKLSLINHLGVGRYLLSHLHGLLQPEGQAGPHVLLLSGTSWAGGKNSNSRATSSPCFDVQVGVSAILRQPHEELRAIEKSFFKLVPLTYENGKQVRVSGENPQDRPNVLDYIAKQLFTPKRDYNQFESDWLLAENKWGMSYLKNRRRVLLVVNSYPDALHVGRTLQQQRVNSGLSNWQIFALVKDDKEGVVQQDSNATIPRSLVEDFGLKQEYSILVAPIQVISRGHNILNSEKKAAISLIYFLHRPHPRPDDMAPVIGELNRYAISHLNDGMSKEQTGSFKRRADILSRESKEIIRSRMASSFGYGSLSDARKQQFAWDFLAPTWQTIGRGIRNGCPVGVGFIDRQFAPHSFSGKEDSGKSSVLVKSIETLAEAVQGQEESIANELYGPLFAALKKTEGLLYGENS